MTVAFQAGYVLPGGDLPLSHSRILHRGNMQPVRTMTASVEQRPSFPAVAALTANTSERFKPFVNAALSSVNFASADWTKTGVTVDSDNQTLRETADNSEHRILQARAFSAGDQVLAFVIERQTSPEIRLIANDGTSDFSCFFDLRDLSIGAAAGGALGAIVDRGDGTALVSMSFTTVAGNGNIQLQLSDGSQVISYAGNNSATIKVHQAITHAALVDIQLSGFGAQANDCLAVAAHNLGGVGRMRFYHTGITGPNLIETITPNDNSSIMLIFPEITSSEWFIRLDRAPLPEVGIFRAGKLLQMQGRFLQGYMPGTMNRATQTRGNISETGEWLGRSKRRTALDLKFRWPRLTNPWCRSNLEGRFGMIEAIEDQPFFIAPRPDGNYGDEAFYAWTSGNVNGPSFSQRPNLMSWSLSASAYQGVV